uniref:Uncharacterized protein n=1 Tax=Arundo donax TaxID=35708 RepID=A0A0A9AET5_ARUDO
MLHTHSVCCQSCVVSFSEVNSRSHVDDDICFFRYIFSKLNASYT